MLCRRQVADLQERKQDFEQKQAKLVVIGNGPHFFIQGFREDVGYDGIIYTDPSLKSYQVLNFKRDLKSFLGLKSVKESLRALTTGHMQQKTQGDALQQGGVLVISPQGTIPYLHVNQEAGDHAPIEQILKACS
ncbi:MAG: hypothetical protein HQM11_04220 [SAR324 cluster bacterium]|nr:hypothetical protein [SAR324 cluster bacterium]